MKTVTSLLLTVAFASRVFAAPPLDSDEIPEAEKECGKDYELVPNGFPRARANYWGCTNAPGKVDADIFLTYDVAYNGSVTVEWNQNPPCGTDTTRSDTALLSIGQMVHPANSSLTRSVWQNNPFYFSFDSRNTTTCSDVTNEKTASCPPWFRATSQSPGKWWSQDWTTSSKKTNNGFEISGKITTTHVNDNGYAIYTTGGCEAGNYANGPVTAADEITMQGTITPEKAEISFTVGKVFMDYHSTPTVLGFQPTFKFIGHAIPGAKLITSGDQIATEGVAEDPHAKENQAAIDKIKKWLFPVIGGVAGLIALSIILCCVCCIRRSKRNKSAQFIATNNLEDPNQQYAYHYANK